MYLIGLEAETGVGLQETVVNAEHIVSVTDNGVGTIIVTTSSTLKTPHPFSRVLAALLLAKKNLDSRLLLVSVAPNGCHVKNTQLSDWEYREFGLEPPSGE